MLSSYASQMDRCMLLCAATVPNLLRSLMSASLHQLSTCTASARCNPAADARFAHIAEARERMQYGIRLFVMAHHFSVLSGCSAAIANRLGRSAPFNANELPSAALDLCNNVERRTVPVKDCTRTDMQADLGTAQLSSATNSRRHFWAGSCENTRWKSANLLAYVKYVSLFLC